jgi:glyoxylase-like metal-dependent hydrolase (beta-lactamase superfamily II)
MREIAPGVAWLPLGIANAYLVGKPDEAWLLVDTGEPARAEAVRAAAEARYGAGTRPAAIVLTHGHVDHAGSALELANLWGVSVYAHPLELPFLTGLSTYPPPDPTVGGFLGLATRFVSALPVNLGDRVRELPPDGEVPELPGWRWHATPGHAPGHVSLFREEDATLLAGDAVTTVNLDSFPAVVAKEQRVSRPPSPATIDWPLAKQSVANLAALQPRTLGAGHGLPMSGPYVATELQALADTFQPPAYGRYVMHPVLTDERGVITLPPPVPDALPGVVAGLGAAALVGMVIGAASKRRR